jgi:hypothetical protein
MKQVKFVISDTTQMLIGIINELTQTNIDENSLMMLNDT